MTEESLERVCREAMSGGKYVLLNHRGVWRDVYPFGIRGDSLYCWCSLHGDRQVERMKLRNIYDARVSGHDVGYVFSVPSDFASD